MSKDEMKNRISLALKDPILQQGFELICKNLAELEKENTELKKNNLKIEIALIVVETIDHTLMMAVVIISVYGNRSKIQNCKKREEK